MPHIAIIIPAYNEELTIKNVILDFYLQLSSTNYNYIIYIVDNNSTDKTNQIAKQIIEESAIPAQIIFVKRQGKANAVREIFRLVEADIYIMIDADSTYWAEDINKFIEPIINHNMDMVIGDRISSGVYKQENKRSFHDIGNLLVKRLINFIFNSKLNDIMTGYRGFSRRLVKSYPIICEGFELETDMTIFCLAHKFNVCEVPIKFTDRPCGSVSKLNTFSDGFKVILTIFNLFRNYKPLQFFGIIGVILFLLGLGVGILPIAEYIKFHYIYRLPSAILSVGIIISSFLSFSIALILDSVRRDQNINFELHLLNQKHTTRYSGLHTC
ncbi:MAG: glycosyltransferase [Burkholderiales bacterium]|nr:glycosyltransferase [Burkholderiales bacterium]